MLVDEPAADLGHVHLGRLVLALSADPPRLLITTLDGTKVELPTEATTFHVEQGLVHGA